MLTGCHRRWRGYQALRRLQAEERCIRGLHRVFTCLARTNASCDYVSWHQRARSMQQRPTVDAQLGAAAASNHVPAVQLASIHVISMPSLRKSQRMRQFHQNLQPIAQACRPHAKLEGSPLLECFCSMPRFCTALTRSPTQTIGWIAVGTVLSVKFSQGWFSWLSSTANIPVTLYRAQGACMLVGTLS
jgi:hypothetical protein